MYGFDDDRDRGEKPYPRVNGSTRAARKCGSQFERNFAKTSADFTRYEGRENVEQIFQWTHCTAAIAFDLQASCGPYLIVGSVGTAHWEGQQR